MFYFSCAQLYRILHWFPTGHRVEAAITLYARCVDIEQFFSVQRLLTPPEIGVLKRKLGALEWTRTQHSRNSAAGSS